MEHREETLEQRRIHHEPKIHFRGTIQYGPKTLQGWWKVPWGVPPNPLAEMDWLIRLRTAEHGGNFGDADQRFDLMRITGVGWREQIRLVPQQPDLRWKDRPCFPRRCI
jgi:hypothetical protein